ncbi:MAG: thiosulfate oxidation carrier protein SoxY [Hyphomicrobiaceae bacterium]|nr:thiosulfate oxidation carrier protein SoxY [Hyphomicrobiaceae bacterium]
MHSVIAPKSRREILVMASAGVAACLLPASFAHATAETVSAEIAKLYAGKKLIEGRIKLDLPSIAENGLVVPLNFEVESPMTEADYVKAIHFFADENPSPNVAAFHFTPMSPKAAAAIRIRLAKTQNIIAVAEMSNGDVYTARQEVKVTIGGCGG